MNELRMILVAALCGVVLLGCGDDDRPPGDMGTPDMNAPDMNVPVDLGPLADLGRDAGGSMCPVGPCDLVTNGCPPGQGCYFLSMGAGMPAMPLCDTSGIGVLDAACTTYSDCAAGYTCQGSPGTCQKFCCGDSSADCPAGASCSTLITDMAGNPTGAALCNSASNCGIFGSDCSAGEGCYTIGGDGTTDCAMAGTLAPGAACMFTNDCMAGFSCLAMSAGGGHCFKNCDTVDMDPGCTGTDTCTSRRLPAPLTNLGACMPAAP